MNTWILHLNPLAAAWLAALGRACWQGGLAFLLVWAVCRAFHRLPARAKSWLWRLAYLKLLVAFLWATPIALPLLPAGTPRPAPEAQPTVSAAPFEIPSPAVSLAVEAAPAQPISSASTRALPARLQPAPPVSLRPNAASWVLLIWSLGLGAFAICAWRDLRRARLLLRGCAPVTNPPLLECAAELARSLRLRAVPSLMMTEAISSPLLLAGSRPVIVLPCALASGSTLPHLRLMIAHEMAHLKRFDLWWVWLAVAGEGLFFFHPLVWLARHEWRLTQEMACDEIVVRMTRVPASAYGDMLVGVAALKLSNRLEPLLLTLGLTETKETLARRLNAMKLIKLNSTKRMALATATILVVSAASVLPWRLVAQPAPPARAASPSAIRWPGPGGGMPEPPATASEPFHRSGRVLKPNGEPAIGALVLVAGAKNQQTTELQTGAGGKFEVEWTRTSATQPYMLVVRDVADNLGAMEDLEDADDPMEIRLEPALDLVVRTESGQAPVTNADLLLSCRVGTSSVWMPGLSLKTNKPGQYEIPGLVPGKPYGLVVSAPGFGRRSFYQLPPSPAGQQMHPVELEPADQIVAGQVVDLGGAPVPNVKLSLSGPEQVSLTNMGDTEGKFVFEHLVKTNYLILANAPPIGDGGARSLAQIDPISLGQFAANPPTSGAVSANGGDTNVVLCLGESKDDHTGRTLMKLTGVIRGPDGKPAAGAAVMLFPESFAGSLGVRADRNGGYQIFWRHLYQNVNRGYVIARDLPRNLAVAEDFSLDVTNLDAPLKPAVTLSGTVREKNGGPMAGAQVKLWVKVGNADDPLDGLTLATDGQGNYEFKCLPADLQYSLAASAEDHGRTLQPVNTEGASGRLEIAPIEVEPANSLVAGKVLDENDKPVSGTTVSVSSSRQYPQQMTTDGSGAFHFKVVEGAVEVEVNSRFVPAQSGDTNVILRFGQLQAIMNAPRAHPLSGHVTGPDGKPAPRASVQLYPSFGAAQSARTGADGQYQLEWPPIADERNRLLLVRDVNHNLAAIRELTGEVSNLNVQLLPAITLRGHVQGDDGKPVFNASLSVAIGSGAAQQPLNDLTATSDSFGNYEIKALPEGRQYQIYVSASKFGNKQLEVRAAAQGASNMLSLKPIVLRVANLLIAGRVVDEENKSVSGVAVYSRGLDQPNDSATSDSEGRFSLNVCSGQVIVISYTRHAWEMQGEVTAKAGDTNVVLRLHRGETPYMDMEETQSSPLKGVVKDPDGHPDTNARVSIWFDFHGDKRGVKTSTNGEYQLTWVHARRVSESDYLLVRDLDRNLVACEPLKAGMTKLDAKLQPAMTITGLVQDDHGRPVPEANLMLVISRDRASLGFNQTQTRADAQGRFELKCLPLGDGYVIGVSAKGHARGEAHIKGNAPARRTELKSIVLKTADRELAGIVQDSNGKPVGGENVVVSGDGQQNEGMATDSHGRFHFQVCDGNIHLSVTGNGHEIEANAKAGDTNLVLTVHR
jgi:beta-lactamase regulating signal transducer with metallopeptidase domain